MASRSLDALQEPFLSDVRKLIELCELEGVTMVPFATLRDPYEQARIWRQSRTTASVEAKIEELRAAGAGYLAHCIESVGPQSGPDLTSAIPGYSWHQWGDAVDCYWRVGNDAEWSSRVGGSDKNGYRVYGRKARELGLVSGGYWSGRVDWPHVQAWEGSPGKYLSVVEINDRMQARFSGLEDGNPTSPEGLGKVSTSSGLTQEERQVMEHLVGAWTKFRSLPRNYSSDADLEEFMASIHCCQNILAARGLSRIYPLYWGGGVEL